MASKAPLPENVVAAKERHDVPALSAMGRKGARNLRINNDIRRTIAAEERYRPHFDRATLAVEANEHECPIDDSPLGNVFTGDEFRTDI